MTASNEDASDSGDNTIRKKVKLELDDTRQFVNNLKMDDIKNGNWFVRLISFALERYAKEIDAEYFRTKYPNLPADAVVQARIKMATRYAAIEGGLTSGAYTGAVATTIGSGGGASPLTVSAGVSAFTVDLTYSSQLQLKLAYDISVLYRVPLDLQDPDDLLKLVQIAFSIKAGEGISSAAVKGTPAVIRPIIKKIFSGSTLAAMKSLPVIGKYLLQRNLIKFAIPVIGVPLSVGVNYWVTRVSGNKARNTMRNVARIVETSDQIAFDVGDEIVTTLWVMWMVIMSNNRPPTDNELNLLHYVTVRAKAWGIYDEALETLRNSIELDTDKIWDMLKKAGNLKKIYEAALISASVDGRISASEIAILRKISKQAKIKFDEKIARSSATSWK